MVQECERGDHQFFGNRSRKYLQSAMTTKLDVTKQIERAADWIRVGNQDAARKLLIQALEANPENDLAWLCMAYTVDTNDLRKECLEEALKHNPHNQSAKRALKELQSPKPKARRPAMDRRKHKLSKATQGILGLAVMTFLCGLLLVFVNESRHEQDLAFQAEGQVTQAHIVDKYQTYGRSSKNYIEYTYQVGGKRYTETEHIRYQYWTQLQIGNTINISYLPSDPDHSRSPYEGRGEPDEEYKNGWLLAGAFLIPSLLVIGIVLVAQLNR